MEPKDNLIKNMKQLIDILEKDGTKGESILKTGDVLAALEVFVFATYTNDEQEVIFSQARTKMDNKAEGEPDTQR